MFDGDDPVRVSCHLRMGEREAVVRALRQVADLGAPLPVWPPRALTPGALLSPERYGWVGLWGVTEPADGWVPRLTGTLECTGAIFRHQEEEYWLLELFRDGRRLLQLSSPREVAAEVAAYERAWEELEREGVADPAEEVERLGDRADRLLQSGELTALPEDAAALREVLPASASLQEALRLLRAWDRIAAGEPQAEPAAFVEDALETFANYLGIPDAAWDPRDDLETLLAGDYEDSEGLPLGWEEFVLLPVRRAELRMIDG